MKELEIEFKNILAEADYQTLQDLYFQNIKPVVQKNYYIDTKALDLRENRMLLRVREKNGGQVMTLKVPTDRGVLEFHGEVDVDVTEGAEISAGVIPSIIIEEFRSRNIEVDNVYVYGVLETKRQETDYKNGLLVLDHSNYLGQEDFELEFEVSDYDRGETDFLNLLESHQIERRTEVTKSGRFYARLSELKKEQ